MPFAVDSFLTSYIALPGTLINLHCVGFHLIAEQSSVLSGPVTRSTTVHASFRLKKLISSAASVRLTSRSKLISPSKPSMPTSPRASGPRCGLGSKPPTKAGAQYSFLLRFKSGNDTSCLCMFEKVVHARTTHNDLSISNFCIYSLVSIGLVI